MTNESRSLSTQCRILIPLLSSSSLLSHHSHSTVAAQWRIIIDRTRKTLGCSLGRSVGRQHKRRRTRRRRSTMMFPISFECAHCDCERVTQRSRRMRKKIEEAEPQLQSLSPLRCHVPHRTRWSARSQEGGRGRGRMYVCILISWRVVMYNHWHFSTLALGATNSQ